MALCRAFVRGARFLQPKLSATPLLSTRTMAGETGGLVLTSMDASGVATVQMNRPPVNGLSLELLTELGIVLDKLDAEKSCQGIILTSATNGIFSAGLDIMEMYQPNEARLREFWRTFQEAWMKLYVARHSVIAAVNGHAPAGGCMLAMSCDHRIMSSGKYSTGLNETKLGIVAPFWLMETMVNTIGLRESERALQLGLLYSAEDALGIGLVDKVVGMEQVLPTAQEDMKQWLQIPAAARQLTKLSLRMPFVEKLRRKQQEDIDNFAKFVMKDSVQKALDMYLKSLKKKN